MLRKVSIVYVNCHKKLTSLRNFNNLMTVFKSEVSCIDEQEITKFNEN